MESSAQSVQRQSVPESQSGIVELAESPARNTSTAPTAWSPPPSYRQSVSSSHSAYSSPPFPPQSAPSEKYKLAMMQSVITTTHTGQKGRSTSLDINMGGYGGKGASAGHFKKRSQSLVPIFDDSFTGRRTSLLVWRDKETSFNSPKRRWRTRRTIGSAILLLVTTSTLYLLGFFSPAGTGVLGGKGARLFGKTCNPYAVPGQMHVDYSEPSNNYWEPSHTSGGTCVAPRFMQTLREGNYDKLEWLRNRTVMLIGDSIERDHVTQFCDLLGQPVTIAKGNHKYAVPVDFSATSASVKNDRLRRLALKGLQESTLPRVCYIPEANFLLTNVYHFGLDELDYWKGLDQFHGPGSIEERFTERVQPYLKLLEQDGRQEPDIVEISSGMYDLARWAQQDMSAQRSTEDPLTDDRISWYRARTKKFMDITTDTFPNAMKMWRGSTLPEDQAAELDYFNDRFGHSPETVTPHFAVDRVQQLDTVVRKLAEPYKPSSRTANALGKRAIFSTKTFVYNAWSSIIRGVPAHQLDRLHGNDLATPAAVIWSDIMLWHLKQTVLSSQAQEVASAA